MSDKETTDTCAFSRHLSTLLDNIGYSPQIVKHRRKVYATTDKIFDETHDDLTRITAGSKGEGFSSYCESDNDFLRTHRYIVCTLPCEEPEIENKDKITIFEMISDQCTPGHYKLKRNKAGSYPLPKHAEMALLMPNKTDSYISSDKFTKSLFNQLTSQVNGGYVSKEKSGPAVPQALGALQNDHVYGFRCKCQESILSEWISRPRKNNWPSSELIQDVTRLEAQIVPVGGKASECQDLEWRICFIPGEMKLTHSLNEAQYKIYILLKLINKSVLKKICPEISSYIMKNIVYWLVESRPQEIFTIDNLFDNLMIALSMLEKAIEENSCPYYMLPQRNLLSGRLSVKDIQTLVETIRTLREEGPQFILRCDKIKDARTMPAVELEIKGRKRDELEMAVLELREFKCTYQYKPNSSWEEKDKQLYANTDYMNIVTRVRDLAWPEWRQHYTTREDMQKKMSRRLEQILI